MTDHTAKEKLSNKDPLLTRVLDFKDPIINRDYGFWMVVQPSDGALMRLDIYDRHGFVMISGDAVDGAVSVDVDTQALEQHLASLHEVDGKTILPFYDKYLERNDLAPRARIRRKS